MRLLLYMDLEACSGPWNIEGSIPGPLASHNLSLNLKEDCEAAKSSLLAVEDWSRKK